jgi:hypothetical protein
MASLAAAPSSLLRLCAVLLASWPLACAAGQDTGPNDDGDDDGAEVGGTGGDGGSSGTLASTGGASSSGPGSTSSGAGASGDGPMGNYGPNDAPPFKTGAELCAYVNEERLGYSSHERYRGLPWSGEYHQEVTWPMQLAVDTALSKEAAAVAGALASGQSPEGAPFSDGAPALHQYLYVSGVSTASYTVSTLEAAGDWTTDIAGNLTAGITANNGTARMALFYQDSGSGGPALGRVGCGGAATPSGERWWVVKLAP